MSVSKEQRLRALQHGVARLDARLSEMYRTNSRWSWARVISFVAAVAVSAAALFTVGAWLFWICLVGLGALFIAIVAVHGRFEQSILRHETWRTLQQQQMARMRLAWREIPAAFEQAPRYEHPFEADVDLVGPRSLHRLMDTTTTTGGSALLRNWLTSTEPHVDSIEPRQALVRELRPLARFRTKLVLGGTLIAQAQAPREPAGAGHDVSPDGAPVAPKWDANVLVEWFANEADRGQLRRWLLGLTALAALNALLFLLERVGLAPLIWPYTLALYGVLVFYAGSFTAGSDLFEDAAKLQGVLRQMTELFGHLERFSYRNAPRLRQLCEPFAREAEQPSHYLRRLSQITNATALRGNPLVWLLLNVVVPWDLYFALRLAQCKAEVAEHIDTWLDVWYQLEALSALANLGHLNPRYTMPHMRSPVPNAPDADPLLQMRQMGHPLLPDVETPQPKVCNDFTVAQRGQVAILTGSNMSGKSTFLRAVGVNLALAYAGGPVDAAALETIPWRLFTCIKVSDSVTDGISYFYAEVQRLQRLLRALHEPHALPLFFCIDEIFRGTNNRERLLGSRAYIQALTEQNGSGLISTHDLELVHLADDAPLISNYHFRDDVVRDGAGGERMTFDYVLRPGPCPTTNALRIMAAAGLPVDGASSFEGRP